MSVHHVTRVHALAVLDRDRGRYAEHLQTIAAKAALAEVDGDAETAAKYRRWAWMWAWSLRQIEKLLLEHRAAPPDENVDIGAVMDRYAAEASRVAWEAR